MDSVPSLGTTEASGEKISLKIDRYSGLTCASNASAASVIHDGLSSERFFSPRAEKVVVADEVAQRSLRHCHTTRFAGGDFSAQLVVRDLVAQEKLSFTFGEEFVEH